jgi:threonine dehydrogenase-like Zn-dependent dehydrogenase
VIGLLLDALRARRIDADAFITHEIELADVPAVLPDIHEHPARYLKVIVRTQLGQRG